MLNYKISNTIFISFKLILMIHTQVQIVSYDDNQSVYIYIYDLVVLFVLVQTIVGFILWWMKLFLKIQCHAHVL
jgi:hypothetical protein